MPFSPKAHRLFAAIATGSAKPRPGLTREKAAVLMAEGVKPGKAARVGKVIRRMK